MNRAIDWRGCMLVLLMLALAGWGRPAAGQEFAQLQTVLNQTGYEPGSDAVLAIVLDIEDGYHAQSHAPLDPNLIPFKVTLEPNAAFEARPPIYPEGHIEEYPQLGRLSVYTGRLVAYVPIRVNPDAPPGPIEIRGTVQYQICDDAMCFPPEFPQFSVTTQVVPAGTAVEQVRPQLFAGYDPAAATAAPPPAGDGPAGAVVGTAPRVGWSLPVAFGAAFVAGLLFNIMPCVLPVLPIKAMGFYEVAHHRRSQAFLFGFVFALGLISIFVILALIVLVFKAFTWGELFSQPWFIWPIVGLLVLLAMGLFGGWDVNLPVAVYSFSPRHDTYSGNFFWGALAAILATPCTAPLLPALLIWATAQPTFVGVPAVVMVGVGMASPYLVLSAFPELARKLPRTGPWSELFKQMLGFMLLAAAAYFAGGRLVHGVGFWWIVVAVVAVASFFLLARTVQLTQKAAPVAFSAMLAVAMLGGTLWWTARITGMLSGGGATAGIAQNRWTTFSDDAFALARASGKPVLVKFTANWCATCQYIEGTVFQESSVWDAIARGDVVTFKVDLTDANAPGKQLLLQLNPAGGIPLTAIYAAGAEHPIVLASIYNTSELLAALTQAVPQVASVGPKAD